MEKEEGKEGGNKQTRQHQPLNLYFISEHSFPQRK